MTDARTLPPAARQWLDRSSPSGQPPASRVQLRQNGEFDSNGRWLKFGADAVYEAEPFTFEWRARLRVLPGMWVNAVDGHSEVTGWGGAKMWGIRSMGERGGPEVHAMQLIRSIAELAWLPDLAESAAGLGWADAGSDGFTISGRAGERDVLVRFEVDPQGDITRARCAARPFDVPEGFEESPWRLDYGDHRELDGARIPVSAVATYEHADDPWEYMRVEIIGRERS